MKWHIKLQKQLVIEFSKSQRWNDTDAVETVSIMKQTQDIKVNMKRTQDIKVNVKYQCIGCCKFWKGSFDINKDFVSVN